MPPPIPPPEPLPMPPPMLPVLPPPMAPFSPPAGAELGLGFVPALLPGGLTAGEVVAFGSIAGALVPVLLCPCIGWFWLLSAWAKTLCPCPFGAAA